MRLTELEPRWVHENIFIFKCPHCKEIFLSCKNIAMKEQEQWKVFEDALGKDFNLVVVACKDEMAWGISSKDFNTVTVTPSLDASNSGHWHGHITNGEAT